MSRFSWWAVGVGVPARPVAGWTVLGASLLGCAVAWPDTTVMGPGVSLGMAVLAGTAALALDEAAEEVARSTPTSVSRRYAARLTRVVLPLGLGLTLLAVVSRRSQALTWWITALELAGLAAIAVGSAALLGRRRPSPGARVAEGVVLAVLGLIIAGRLLDRWVQVLALDEPPQVARTVAVWLGVVGVAGALLFRATRDPLP